MIPLQGGANVPVKTERRGYDLSSFDNQLSTKIPCITPLLTAHNFSPYYLLLSSLLLTTPLLTTYSFPPYYLKAKLSHIVFLAFALHSLSFWHAFS